MVGAKYAYILSSVKVENYLTTLASEILGHAGVSFVAFILIVSCLATATITSSIFADFLYEDILRKKISRKVSIILTLGIAYILSLIGFQSICSFLDSILTWIYPFLILYALYNMAIKFFGTSSPILKN